jgi:hypothetical protein
MVSERYVFHHISAQWHVNTYIRVNYYLNLRETHTPHTQAPAQLAKQRSSKEGPIARSVPIKQMVCLPLSHGLSLLTISLACAMCGKENSKSTAAAPVIAGQKFTLK